MPHRQAPYAHGQPVPQVHSYLTEAILVTLFCCLPFGIVSIVFASQVNGKLMIGDIRGAQDASNKAKCWYLVSLCIGLIGGILYILAIAAGL